MNDKKLLDQSTWRKVGAISVALAALMAIYAVAGGVLRDSVIHLARLASEGSVERKSVGKPGLFCLVYWLVFSLLILISLYMAALDLRFIRLQYVLEKQALIRESLSRDPKR